uniref:Uncharacterized protein n=1 Tax=viral metagenome TaxID=1070528 RepID=A0A6C0KXJ3_9ZZZZ
MANTETNNQWIPLVKRDQELEKIRFSYDLRKNPDDFNRYVSERVERISKETLDKKRAAFQKAHTDMGRYYDMDHNANFYKLRNTDVLNLQDQMLERSRAAFQGVQYDKDLTRRQAEINEWYFNDKLETLFFLQMFFVVLLSMSIIMYLQKNGYTTTQFAAYLTIILLCVVVGTGVYRSRFTKEYRDNRFWNKRNFREKAVAKTSLEADLCAPPGDNSFIPKGISDCASKAKNDALLAANSSLAYAADSGKPYGQIALGTAEVIGAGLGVAGAGLGVAAIAPVVGAGLLLGQGLSDTRTVANRGGAAANRAEAQLEADTLAYLTGDGRAKADPNAKTTCPF